MTAAELTLGVAPAILLAAMAAAANGEEKAPLKIVCKRDNDRAEVKTAGDVTTVDVHSPFGISQATLTREGESWPRRLVLRLHLRGLENFQAGHDKATLHASVGSRDNQPDVRLWKNGEETKGMERTDALWTEVRLVGSDGKPTGKIPLEGGYIEIPLPRALFDGNPRSLTVRWIDFYRG